MSAEGILYRSVLLRLQTKTSILADLIGGTTEEVHFFLKQAGSAPWTQEEVSPAPTPSQEGAVVTSSAESSSTPLAATEPPSAPVPAPETGLVEESARTSLNGLKATPRGMRNAQDAYAALQAGASPEEVTRIGQYGNWVYTLRALARYAEKNNLPWPVHQRRAAKRPKGTPRAAVARAATAPPSSPTLAALEREADVEITTRKGRGLPPELRGKDGGAVRKIRGPGSKRGDLATGQQCYMLRTMRGQEWSTIRDSVYPNAWPSLPVKWAEKWAKQVGAPWPAVTPEEAKADKEANVRWQKAMSFFPASATPAQAR